MKTKRSLKWKNWDEITIEEKRKFNIFIPSGCKAEEGRFAFDENNKYIKATFPFPVFFKL